MKKQIYRSALRAQRRALSSQDQSAHANAVCFHLSQLSVFKNAHTIAAYQAQDGELNPEPIIQLSWSLQKSVYLPALDKNTACKQLQFVSFTAHSSLIKNRFGILEPALLEPITSEQLDLILIPLVGFDKKGNRLGMGSGFYDITLARTNHPLRIGIAHACQELAKIDQEPHDVPLDILLTEEGVVYQGNRSISGKNSC